MNRTSFPSAFDDEAPAHVYAAALARLLGNLSGFVYRCRPDAKRTMEFISAHCRDLTGYDPHRFIGNQSLTYAFLIHPADRARVDWTIADAAGQGRRFTCGYRLQTAYGHFVEVIDRGIGVLDASGALCAIEGYVDRACGQTPQAPGAPPLASSSGSAELEIHSDGLIADDDATSELVDRLPWARNGATCALQPHVE